MMHSPGPSKKKEEEKKVEFNFMLLPDEIHWLIFSFFKPCELSQLTCVSNGMKTSVKAYEDHEHNKATAKAKAEMEEQIKILNELIEKGRLVLHIKHRDKPERIYAMELIHSEGLELESLPTKNYKFGDILFFDDINLIVEVDENGVKTSCHIKLWRVQRTINSNNLNTTMVLSLDAKSDNEVNAYISNIKNFNKMDASYQFARQTFIDAFPMVELFKNLDVHFDIDLDSETYKNFRLSGSINSANELVAVTSILEELKQKNILKYDIKIKEFNSSFMPDLTSLVITIKDFSKLHAACAELTTSNSKKLLDR